MMLSLVMHLEVATVLIKGTVRENGGGCHGCFQTVTSTKTRLKRVAIDLPNRFVLKNSSRRFGD